MLVVGGNISGKTETATLAIWRALEERSEVEAHALAVVLASVSVGLLLVMQGLQRRQRRASAERAEVDGRVRDVPTSVLDRVDEAGGELDDGALTLGRSLSAEGRSRAYLGGRSVPASVLVDLSEDLVAVHGQSDQQRLLAPARPPVNRQPGGR